MLLRSLLILCALLAACSTAADVADVPTLMVLPTQAPTLSPAAQNAPLETSTALPQVVGVPTPTPPYSSLGAFIGKLSSGIVADGNFDENALSHVYLFDGKTGDYVNIEMSRLTGTVDPVLTLYSPTGLAMATDDNSGGNRAALLRNIRLAEDGLYSVQAGGGGFTGRYRIVMVNNAAPDPLTPTYVTPVPSLTPTREIASPTFIFAAEGIRLDDHQPVVGVINRTGDFNRFSLFALAGESLTIGASPLPDNPTLKLRLELYGPAGDLVSAASSSSANAGGDALISSLRIENTGVYVIFVTAEIPATGEYKISYGIGPTYESALRGEALPNQINAGEIARRGLRDVWQVYLNRDDVISAAVSPSEDSTLDPLLEITTAKGELIAIDDNSGTNSNALVAQVQIPETGLYHFRVRAAQTATSGGYHLVWRYINLAPTATPLPGRVLLMSVDDRVPDNMYLFYPFQGTAGQQVEISVIGEVGTGFDPVAALIGPDGAIIAEGDDSENSLNPYFIARLPVDGTYTVRVNGYLKGGAFTLIVNALY